MLLYLFVNELQLLMITMLVFNATIHADSHAWTAIAQQ